MENPAIIGFATSIITEVFKLIPFLRQNSLASAITAIVVLTVLTYVTAEGLTWDRLVMGLVFALTSYKAIIQPVAVTSNLKTQK